MTAIKLQGSSSWLPILLVSILFIGGIYFYKDHQLKQAVEQYQAQQVFLKEEMAKFGVIDSQFDQLLQGRTITLQDIEASQQRVQKLVATIEKLEKIEPHQVDSIKLQEALDILGL